MLCFHTYRTYQFIILHHWIYFFSWYYISNHGHKFRSFLFFFTLNWVKNGRCLWFFPRCCWPTTCFNFYFYNAYFFEFVQYIAFLSSVSRLVPTHANPVAVISIPAFLQPHFVLYWWVFQPNSTQHFGVFLRFSSLKRDTGVHTLLSWNCWTRVSCNTHPHVSHENFYEGKKR